MKSEYYEDENVTQIWRDYEKGVMYNRTKNLYTNTEKNYNFYYGVAKCLKIYYNYLIE